MPSDWLKLIMGYNGVMLDAIRLVWAIMTALVSTPTPTTPPLCDVKQEIQDCEKQK
jgi:hypothetical protein